MVRRMKWHCPPVTGLEIRVLAVWGRARYLSVTEAPYDIESFRVSGEETFSFFEILIVQAGALTTLRGLNT